MPNFLFAAVGTFVGLFVIVPLVSGFCRAVGFYTIVQERQCRVYVLFGKVILTLDEPGMHGLADVLELRIELGLDDLRLQEVVLKAADHVREVRAASRA
jgi:hypothetical protein